MLEKEFVTEDVRVGVGRGEAPQIRGEKKLLMSPCREVLTDDLFAEGPECWCDGGSVRILSVPCSCVTIGYSTRESATWGAR